VENGGTDVLWIFGTGSFGMGGNTWEVVTEIKAGSGLMVGGRGGTFSISVDDETLDPGTLALSELTKDRLRMRRPSLSFRLASALAVFESFLQSILVLGLVLPIAQLSHLGRGGWEGVVVLLVPLREPALFILVKLPFLTGMMTPSPPSPKRENLGVESVTDIQFSPGSREVEGGRGWSGKPELNGRTSRGIGWSSEGGNEDEVVGLSLVSHRCPYFMSRFAIPASSRIAFRAHRGIVGIGGAVWLLSVRTVREDELEARLVVEAECKLKLERPLFAF